MLFTLLAAVILGALFGIAASSLASRRGQNARTAFLFGFFLWALGLALVAFRPHPPAGSRP